MYLKFQVMFKDDVIADVEMDHGVLTNYKRYDVWCMQMFFFPDLTVTAEMMFDFLQDRIIPRTRENIEELLRNSGLETYDVYKMLRMTHGVDPNDYLWIKFDGEELNWKDVNPRAS